jgi:hypothetical protein
VGNEVESNTRYVRAYDALGSTWPHGVTVEGITGGEELFLLETAPAVFSLGGMFLLALANDALGDTWSEGSEMTVPPATQADIAVIGGFLAYVIRGEDMLYRRALDIPASAWSEPVHVNPLERASGGTQLLQVSGRPAVLYYDTDLRGLKFRRAADSSGSTWMAPVVLSAAASSSFRGAVVDGRPAALFYNRLDGGLKFVSANGDAGNYWGFASGVPVTEQLTLGKYQSIAYEVSFGDVAGWPVFTYYSIAPGAVYVNYY